MQYVAFIANLFCFHLLNLYVAISAHAKNHSLGARENSEFSRLETATQMNCDTVSMSGKRSEALG